jgi:hypothetical protein
MSDELLRTMARAAEHFDADVERALVYAIAGAHLVVPVKTDPATGASGLWATADDAGRTNVVAFTDASALAAWAGGDAPHAELPGPELCRLAAGAGAAALWINPAGPHGGRLERRMVDVVAAAGTLDFESADDAERTMRLRTTGQGELRLRTPADPPPQAALDALRAAIAASDGVAEARLVEVTDPPPVHLLLVLLLGPGADSEAVAAGLRPAVAGLVPSDQFVDTLPVSGDDDPVLALAREIGVALA